MILDLAGSRDEVDEDRDWRDYKSLSEYFMVLLTEYHLLGGGNAPTQASASQAAQPHISETACEKAAYIWEIHQGTFPVPVIPSPRICNPSNEPDRDTSVSVLDLNGKITSADFIRGQRIDRPSEWQLHLQNSSVANKTGKVMLEIVLTCKKIYLQPATPIWVKAAYEIIDKWGIPVKLSGKIFNTDPKAFLEGTTHVMSLGTKSELQSNLPEYFPDNILRFRVRLNIYKELSPVQITPAESDGKPPPKRRRIEGSATAGLTGLLDSLENLWNSREQTGDIAIKCGGSTIKAHKFILSSRSRVFMGMLDSKMETKEKEKMEVEVDDITPEIMNALLEFLYLGDSTEFDWLNIDNICALIYAADKYWVVPLMNKCYHTLIKIMTLENFGKIAKVTLMYNSGKEFKDEIRHFYECHQVTLNGIQSFR